MITDVGRDIIAKYLLGQVPAFATHISLGVGARPGAQRVHVVTGKKVSDGVATLTSTSHMFKVGDWVSVNINDVSHNGVHRITKTTTSEFSFNLDRTNQAMQAASGVAKLDASKKQNMDFEVARIPITSKGYVTENGVTKMAFAAEMPEKERLLVSEVGLWSAGGNTNALGSDSKALFNFGFSEPWKWASGDTVQNIPFRPILSEGPNAIDDSLVGNVFRCTGDTPLLSNVNRSEKHETPRAPSAVIALRGDTSTIVSENGRLRVSADSHIVMNVPPMDLSRSGPDDEIKIAFSLVSSPGYPLGDHKARIVVEFLHSERDPATNAKMFVEVDSGDYSSTAYHVVTQRMSEIVRTGDFDWSRVRVVRIYVGVSAQAASYYIMLDGLRFENVSSLNPTYGMVGYAVVDDNRTYPKPIYKIADSSNYVEFRMGVGVA